MKTKFLIKISVYNKAKMMYAIKSSTYKAQKQIKCKAVNKVQLGIYANSEM